MKTCRNCKEYWWCKETWSEKEASLGIDRDMRNCPAWKPNHKFERNNYGKK